MNKFQTFQDFFTTHSSQVNAFGFLLDLVLAAFLAYLLEKIYVKYGKSISNREMFSKNFVLLGVTTMLIITIVKSSLALSLGLVGALSIVRFRAAIKEPEELTYLFLIIAIGLGFGAGQRVITIVAFASIVSIMIFKNRFTGNNDQHNMFLTIGGNSLEDGDFDKVIDKLKENCVALEMKRLDESEELIEMSFYVEFEDFNKLKNCKSDLRMIDNGMKITFLDNKGIM